MNSHRTLRLPETLDNAINQADINFAATVRDSLKKQLMEKTVGVCAVTGQLCYQSNFATIGTTTPLGKHLNAPDALDTIDIIEDVYETSSKEIAEGIPQDDGEYTAEYVTDIGVWTYQAERLFFSSVDSTIDEAYQPLVNMRYNDNPDERYPVDTRVYTLLRWIADTNTETVIERDHDTEMSDDTVTVDWIDKIWFETPTTVKNASRQRIENGDETLKHIIETYTKTNPSYKNIE